MVRKDIKKNKKLNYHLYSAMKRSFFKPASWFRGILFPLCEDAETSIREAELIASIIVKVEGL
jgi:essential nuclear protein 1